MVFNYICHSSYPAFVKKAFRHRYIWQMLFDICLDHFITIHIRFFLTICKLYCRLN